MTVASCDAAPRPSGGSATPQAASEDSEDSDIDRRSLDLASSHTSDDDYENNHVFDPSDLKALSVNDFPQY